MDTLQNLALARVRRCGGIREEIGRVCDAAEAWWRLQDLLHDEGIQAASPHDICALLPRATVEPGMNGYIVSQNFVLLRDSAGPTEDPPDAKYE